MNSVVISDLTVANYLKDFVVKYKDDRQKLQAVVKIFPFNRLLECDGVNHELTM